MSVIRHQRQKLLIIEPDELTRWSIKSYFVDSFDVRAADSVGTACRLLKESPADAVVVADAWPNHGADTVEQCARRHNANVTVVRTVTAPPAPPSESTRAIRLEKPFELSSLADLLGAR